MKVWMWRKMKLNHSSDYVPSGEWEFAPPLATATFDMNMIMSFPPKGIGFFDHKPYQFKEIDPLVAAIMAAQKEGQ